MNISWYGHRCFRIEAKEGSVLIDPFGKEVGLRSPRVKDDIVLFTGTGSTRSGLSEMNPEAFLITGPGEYERKGITIHGVKAYGDKVDGTKQGLTTLYRIVAEEISVCHLGALGQEQLTDEQIELIGDVDILMVPVGNKEVLDAKAAAAIVNEIEPKIIIPMQFKVPGLTLDSDGVEKFIKEMGLTPEKTDRLRISHKTLPVEETKLIILQP